MRAALMAPTPPHSGGCRQGTYKVQSSRLCATQRCERPVVAQASLPAGSWGFPAPSSSPHSFLTSIRIFTDCLFLPDSEDERDSWFPVKVKNDFIEPRASDSDIF